MCVASGECEKKSQTFSGSWRLVNGSAFWEWMKSGNFNGSRMKKTGSVIAYKVVIAVGCVELDREPTRVTDCLGLHPGCRRPSRTAQKPHSECRPR